MTVTLPQLRHPTRALLILIVLAATYGCGISANGTGSVGSPRVLSSNEAKRLLQQLPYKYKWRSVDLPQGASSALAGTATGEHQTVLHFGISFGTEAEAVPVPQSGTHNPYDYSQGGGFVYTDDIIVPGGIGKQIKTGPQWHEANMMEVEMEEKLCKASTGEFCPP